MALETGDTLNSRYRIDGVIGKGGMGAVYKGFDNSLGIFVAIKENLNPLPQAVRQFKREAVLLASLRHPNLPRVTDHFLVGDLQYLIMDFIEGDDLKAILEREGALPEKTVLAWAREIIHALTYLHNQNPPVVHRDIKPGNVKINAEEKPVLVDFGIAKVAEKGGITTTGARSLTPGFAPPEQYGSSSTTAQSDQYSLAATMYNLLTGQIPPDSIERTLGQSGLTPPRELNPLISPAVNRALIRAMALNSADRFDTVETFLGALEGRVETEEIVPDSSRAMPTPAVMEPPTKFSITRAAATIAALPASASRPMLLLLSGGVILCLAVTLFFGGLYALNGFPAFSNQPTPSRDSTAPPETAVPTLETTRTPTPAPTDTSTPQPSPTAEFTNTIAQTPMGGGRLIAFVSNRGPDKRYQIYTLDVVTREIRQLTFDAVDKGRLAWSPDGTGIYYEAIVSGGKHDIFYMDLLESSIKNITDNPSDDTHPAVNPLTGLLAFVSTRANEARMIWWMYLDGSSLTNVSRKHDSSNMRMPSEWDPAWSPDGRYLFMVLKPAGPVRVYRWDTISPGLDPQMCTMSSGGYVEGEPAVSPDGSLLAYTRWFDTGGEICVTPADPKKRTECREPLTLRDFNGSPDWSPDGLWLVYNTRREGNNEIYIMTVTGASKTNLTNDPADDLYPAWQPRTTTILGPI